MVSLVRVIIPCLFILMATGCSRPAEPQVIKGEIFGTFFEVTVGSDHANTDLEAIETGILEILDEVDRQMSTYRKDSVLNQLNTAPLQQPVEVDDELYFVLQRSEAIAEMSNGAFDHTVGGLVTLWGFGPEGRVTERPSQSELEKRLEEVGYHFVTLNNEDQTAMRTHDVFVDLSGIAKGYGVDAVSNYLSAEGFYHHLVNIGGDIIAQGMRTNESHWRIGIEVPAENRQVVQHILPIRDVAMVSSGDYRNYFEADGVRYSHTIDPTTGAPIAHNLAGATVLADNATDADGYASAIMVLGPQRGLEFANEHGIAALLVSRDGEQYESAMSDRFKRDYANELRVPRVQ